MASRLTDCGLEPLNTLTNLRVLSISDETITDAGLSFLQGLSRLEKLCLSGTRTTAAGVESVPMPGEEGLKVPTQSFVKIHWSIPNSFRSQNPLDLIERNLVAGAVIELGRRRARRHSCRTLQRSPQSTVSTIAVPALLEVP